MRVLLLLLAAFSAYATNFYVTIAGIGGEPDYDQRFKMWADDIDGSLKRAGGDANVTTMQAPTRDQIRSKLAELSKEVKPADATDRSTASITSSTLRVRTSPARNWGRCSIAFRRRGSLW
jgi:hypothetical protein